MNEKTPEQIFRQLIEQEKRNYSDRMELYNQLLSQFCSHPTANEHTPSTTNQPSSTSILAPSTTIPSTPPTHSPTSITPSTQDNPYQTGTPKTNITSAPSSTTTQPPYPTPAQPRSSRTSSFTKRTPQDQEQTITRAVALGGSFITFIGIVLLIAFAIQNGWLGLSARITLAFIVSAVLAGVALKVRTTTLPVTFLSLASTSLATALITTLITVHYLHWWSAFIGSFIIVFLYGIFSAAALRFDDHKLLSATATLGLLATSIHILENPYQEIASFIILLIPAGIFALSLKLHPNSALRTVGAITLVLGLTQVLPRPGTTSISTIDYLAIALTSLVILGLSVTPLYVKPQDLWLDHVIPSMISPLIGAYVLICLPVLFPNITLVLSAGLIIGLTFTRSDKLGLVRATGQTLLPTALATMLINALIEPVNIVFAVFFMVWLLLLPQLKHWLAWLSWLLCCMIITGNIFLFISGIYLEFLFINEIQLESLSPAIQPLGTAGLIVFVFLAIAAVMFLKQKTALTDLPQPLLYVIGIVALYLSSGAIIMPPTVLAFFKLDSNLVTITFFSMHAAVSISWMALGAFLLLSQRTLKNRAALATGLALAAASVCKLIFFDLSTLGGFPRAIAFLICGLVLLAVAVRRNALQRKA
ncbi:DUF2339 domain-containing protein [Corynebacterium kutscheri]|uniref:Hypothetical membrane protein n=1 Tax=Corynebacterium kutscheri TaxID=35755 RepID=A0A0F6R1M2_9CORY|nr:DUF2339 domain-containing protein [Corynebacterium kutscheri]AKE41128.1 putative membrane protein (DUF2339) [Corynebacterium kutscheri]VEH07036.1 hypothetical membrane protein [Corynebacterium kutscheri]VEH09446.1 hypothetical membrane protein [Corynebacterium kutscheri]